MPLDKAFYIVKLLKFSSPRCFLLWAGCCGACCASQPAWSQTMNGRGFITISMLELERVKIIEAVVQHRLTIVLAAAV